MSYWAFHINKIDLPETLKIQPKIHPKMPPQKRKEDSDSDSDHDSKKQKCSPSHNPESDEEIEFILPAPLLHGRLLVCGATNWDLVGRKQLPKGVKNVGGPNLWGPHNEASMKEKPIRSVVSGCCAVHSVVIDTEGDAYTWGRNDKAQLAQGDTERRDSPTLVDSLSGLNIITAACGRNHTMFLTERGVVYAVGDNKMGQLGIGGQGQTQPSPTKIRYQGPPVSRIACGGEFTMMSDIRGNLYSYGCPEYGQLGHNTDGKYFVKSNKMAFSCELTPSRVTRFIERARDGQIQGFTDVEVQEIACGTNHTVIIDRKKRVFTWGWGGYGRLGHSEQKDELVPRMVKFFDGPKRGATMVAAGSSFTLAVNELGALYMWGKTKLSGEAAMYPKPLTDLSGWKIRSMACCNLSTIMAADASIVSWGCHPTYGELGYGEGKAKTSSIPQEAKPFEGVHIHQVAAGYGHSLFIAREDNDEDEKRLDDLPDHHPPTATD